MHRLMLNNTLFCGTLATPRLGDYASGFRWAELGIRADAFGDTTRHRTGRYAIFAFQGRMTYLTILGYDLGVDPNPGLGCIPKHRGFLVLSTDLSGHLEDAMLAANRMVLEAKSGCHPAIAKLSEDAHLLAEAQGVPYDLAQWMFGVNPA